MATPLQNSLLELYGLVSFLDDHLFGDIEAFRQRYMRGPMEERDFADLRERLRPLCCGFHVWCQLLTHTSRNRDADLIVVDEPEMYRWE